ncbi:MAG: polysaccharide deacetylase family protein, partial [Chthoniobacteraceae bacterium]
MRVLLLLLATALTAFAVDGNRLTYLDDTSSFWPSGRSAKFITPQWIGEPGVDAAVILAIDDLRDTAKYEAVLRPILDRLKRIDGRAPVSIMTVNVPPGDPQLQAWLKEGVSLEVHTLTHPCPLLGKATFEEAQHTCHGGVDLLASIPNNRPVAFRMPCCDSMNSASPRISAEESGEWSAGLVGSKGMGWELGLRLRKWSAERETGKLKRRAAAGYRSAPRLVSSPAFDPGVRTRADECQNAAKLGRGVTEHTTKAAAEAANRRSVVIASGRQERVTVAVMPRRAAQNTIFSILVPPILAPLPDVAAHV